jgi:type II secretory pathway pseudopilin PulG
VVIAIIALLVSILLPSLQQAKELAKSSICLTNLRSFALPLNQYAVSHRDQLVPALYGPRKGDDASEDALEYESWQTIFNNLDLMSAPTSDDPQEIMDIDSPHRCPSGEERVETLPYPWPSDVDSPYDRRFMAAYPHRSTTTGKTYYIHSWYGVSADTYYVKDFAMQKIPRDDSRPGSRDYLRRTSEVNRMSEVATFYDGWHLHRGWGWYTISPRHMNRKRTNVMAMDGSARSASRTSLPLEDFRGKKWRGSELQTFTGLYPDFLWLNGQFD